MLLRCALNLNSLVSETIPYHKDYQVLCSKERTFYKKVSDLSVIYKFICLAYQVLVIRY